MNLGAPKTPLVNYSPNGFGHFLLKFVKCSQSGGKSSAQAKHGSETLI